MKKEEKKIYLTSEGYLEKEEELNHLKLVKRPENIKALKEARAMGDLSENAEYDAARNEQAVLEGRILELEKILENAIIIDKVSTDKVGMGSKVTIKYIDEKEEDTYLIVGSSEADPMNNKISNESPLASVLMNKKAGSIVEVDSPSGLYKVEIISIA